MAKTEQSLSLKQGESLKNLGSKGIWPDWVSKDVQQVYGLRRLKITELEDKLKDLFKSKELTTPIKKRIRDLTRELKTVVETDPKEVFKLNNKGKYRYNIKDFYNAVDPEQAHHIKGLDKYYEPIKQLDDLDLLDLHTEAAKKGHYFGNHPKNRINLQKSLHTGRVRQGVPYFESIHGRIDFQDLSPDEFNDYLNKIVSNESIDDIGSPGGPNSANRSRIEVPESDFWEYGMTSEAKDKFFEMADADQKLANEFKGKSTNPVYFEGKPKTPFLKEFINKNPDASKWPKGTIEAIQSQDAEELIKLNKQIETQKVQDFDSKLAREFGTKPKLNPEIADAVTTAGKLTKFGKIAAGAGAAESAALIAGGNPVAGGIGLAMQTPAVQKQIAKLMAKQGVKLIPGVSLGSGLLQAGGYLMAGKYGKAALSTVGGVAGEFGPAGDAIQAMIDLGLTVDDIKQTKANKPDSDIDMTEGGKVKKYETGIVHSPTGQGDEAFDNVVNRLKDNPNAFDTSGFGNRSTFRQLLRSAK